MLVRLGLTDDSYQLDAINLTMRQWLNAYVPGTDETKLEERLCTFLSIERNSESFALLQWLGLFTNSTFSLTHGSPAQLLQSILQQKWKLKPGELDMIVMKHELTYELEGKTFFTESELVVKGESERLTAMAKTVGLPLGIAAKLVLQQKVKLSGVYMPIQPVLYEPMLAELKQYGIAFTETTTSA
jgi:saccharopine dehydrogenase-like NADP-dependent oxidoreductase